MNAKSTSESYGSAAVALHWASAALIVAMVPLGFVMQSDRNTTLYGAHIAVGAVVLLLTALRLVWKLIDTRPEPAPGLSGLHLKLASAIHVALYITLVGLLMSGGAMIVQSDLLTELSAGVIPDFSSLQSRDAHGALAWLFIALFVAHVAGVILHQVRHGHVLSRMGIGREGVQK